MKLFSERYNLKKKTKLQSSFLDEGTRKLLWNELFVLYEIYEEDFVRTMMDYEMFKQGINAKDFGEEVLQHILYSSDIDENNETTTITIRKD